MTRSASLDRVDGEPEGPVQRPFPSLLLVLRRAGLAIADPRAHDLIDVTIEDVEALMALGGAPGSDGLRPDPPMLDRLDSLGLLISSDDPARAPSIDLAAPAVPGEHEIGLASLRVVLPSVIRLHEGRPLAWDRHADGYRSLTGSQLRLVAGLLHRTDLVAGATLDHEVAQLLSIGILERFDPSADPGGDR